MCMEMIDVGRQFRRQHQCLAKAADAVWGRVAAKIGEPCSPRPAISGASARTPPAIPNATWLLIEVFRKVEQSGSDQAVDWMGCAIGRVAQRDDQDVEPTSLQGKNLLGDKGFGEPRIALQNKGDTTCWPCWRRHTRSRSAPVPQSSRPVPGRANF